MTLTDAQLPAYNLLIRHPGWGTRRVVRALRERGHTVSESSVKRWRREWQLAPAVKGVRHRRRHRAVVLACGHDGEPPAADAEPVAWCYYCGGWLKLGRAAMRERDQLPRVSTVKITAGPPRPPDTPPEHEGEPHFTDRPLIDVLRDWFGPEPPTLEEMERAAGIRHNRKP